MAGGIGGRGRGFDLDGATLLLRGDDAQQELDGLEALRRRLLACHVRQASPDVTERQGSGGTEEMQCDS